MQTRFMLTVACLAAVFFSGCATTSWQDNQKAVIGGVGGAVAGGLIASAIHHSPAVVIGGAIVGGLVGSAVGDRLDAADRKEARLAHQRPAEPSAHGPNAPGHPPGERSN
jgi:surface antigen